MELTHNLTVDNKLKIVQSSKDNKYTFDSLLLANFINIRKKDENIIDLCSGNGPIALLLGYRNPKLKIKCIEIQKHIAELAQKSIKINEMSNRISVYNENLKGISELIGKNKYDIVVCNPPYFKISNNGQMNEKDSVKIARHEVKVTLEEIIDESRLLLANEGRLFMIHRPERLEELIFNLNKYNFSLKRMRLVYSKKDTNAQTVLIEATKKKLKNNKTIVEAPFIVYNKSGEYTLEALGIINNRREEV